VLTQENVLVQLEHLRTHPSVATALAAGELKIHAWVYKMETGQVFAFDPGSGQFVLLDADRELTPVYRHQRRINAEEVTAEVI
jgi:carbonic anhydrase